MIKDKLKVGAIYNKKGEEINSTLLNRIGSLPFPIEINSCMSMTFVDGYGFLAHDQIITDIEENDYGVWIYTTKYDYRLDNTYYGECQVCDKVTELDFDRESQKYKCNNCM